MGKIIRTVIRQTVSAIEKAADDVYEAIKDAVVYVWKEVIAPALKLIFSLFGITDEDVVSVSFSMNKLFEDDWNISESIVKAKLFEMKNGDDVEDAFKTEFMKNISIPKARLRAAYIEATKSPLVDVPKLDFSKSDCNDDVIQQRLDKVESTDGQYIIDYVANKIDLNTYVKFKMRSDYNYLDYRGSLTYDGHVNYIINSIDLSDDGSIAITISQKYYTEYKYRDITKSEIEIDNGYEIVKTTFTGNKATDNTDLSISFDGYVIDIDNTLNDKYSIMLDFVNKYNDKDDRTWNIYIKDNINIDLYLISVSSTDDIDDLTNDSFSISQEDNDTFEFISTDIILDHNDSNNKGNATYTGERTEIYNSDEYWNYSSTPDEIIDNYYFLSNINIIDKDTELTETIDLSDYKNVKVDTVYTNTTTLYEDYSYNDNDLYLVIKFSSCEECNGEWFTSLYNLTANNEEDLALNRSSEIYEDTMPIVIFRNNKEFWDENYDKDLYNEQVKLCKYLGVDFDDMLKGLKDNSSIDDVEDAYLWFYLDPTDKAEVVSKYLYLMWEYINGKDVSWSSSDLNIVNAKCLPYRYKCIDATLAWDKIYYDFYSNTSTKPSNVKEYEHSYTDDSITCKKWVDNNSYFQIKIDSLSSLLVITNGKYKGVVNDSISSGNFPIPLAWTLLDTYFNTLEKNSIFYKSLKLNTNALHVEHLAYYETKAFADFIQIIVIVIVVVVTVCTAGSATEAVYALLEAALTMIAVHYALNWVNDHVSSPWLRAVLDVVILTVAAMTGDVSGWVNALTITASVTSYGVSVYYGAKQEKLQKEYKKFTEAVDEREKEFEEVEETLEQKLSGINAAFLAWLQNPAETEKIIPEYSPLENQRYKAISIQYDNALLYNYERQTQTVLPRY